MQEETINKFVLEISEDDKDVCYLNLPKHPKGLVAGCVAKTIRLLDLIEDYKGPDVYLDFNKDGVLIGIELLND